jgi:hypothetical protein
MNSFSPSGPKIKQNNKKIKIINNPIGGTKCSSNKTV